MAEYIICKIFREYIIMLKKTSIKNLAPTITGCIWISDFTSLVGIPIGDMQ